ncbi:hypothetical protein GPALN_002289 [Globodera pallida]|nr:hypothetical protein GPALN_002289 [Globodera pallida]
MLDTNLTCSGEPADALPKIRGVFLLHAEASFNSSTERNANFFKRCLSQNDRRCCPYKLIKNDRSVLSDDAVGTTIGPFIGGAMQQRELCLCVYLNLGKTPTHKMAVEKATGRRENVSGDAHTIKNTND